MVNLVPRVSYLPAPSLAPGSGKMIDPGNEVADSTMINVTERNWNEVGHLLPKVRGNKHWATMQYCRLHFYLFFNTTINISYYILIFTAHISVENWVKVGRFSCEKCEKREWANLASLVFAPLRARPRAIAMGREMRHRFLRGRRAWLHRVIIYGVARVTFWMLFLHSFLHPVLSNLLHELEVMCLLKL